MAKIAYSFGLSECNRVKEIRMHLSFVLCGFGAFWRSVIYLQRFAVVRLLVVWLHFQGKQIVNLLFSVLLPFLDGEEVGVGGGYRYGKNYSFF